MILVSGIKLPYEASEQDALEEAIKMTRVGRLSLKSATIHKRSMDLRRGHLSMVYSILLQTDLDEQSLVMALNKDTVKLLALPLIPVVTGQTFVAHRPIIVGFGPAGMMAGLVLAKNGFKPLILERGDPMEIRDQKTQAFFKNEKLDTNSNVQFGEGGAGTYSDGKLTTRINDPRAKLVADYLIENGAPAEIAIDAKPHIGTDLLKDIVVSIRKQIISLGGQVLFGTTATDFEVTNNKVTKVCTNNGDFPCETVILACGHSARDTYRVLHKNAISLVPKSFAVGVRIEHRQETINRGLYGDFYGKFSLPQGEYALANTLDGRGCYTFCMCPGGSVIASASEEGGTVTNGMSFHARDGINANSAIVVTVNPSDFSDETPLGGIDFQRALEQCAFRKAGGDFKAPVQLLGDFCNNVPSTAFGSVNPSYNRGIGLCDLNEILPLFVSQHIKDSAAVFGKKIKGFDSRDAVLTGVETRTSAPLRILRDPQRLLASVEGLYPCGEGAGYAGGIMSAAVDGVKVAEQLLSLYKPQP